VTDRTLSTVTNLLKWINAAEGVDAVNKRIRWANRLLRLSTGVPAVFPPVVNDATKAAKDQ
jgi:hypothetical protein